jgi:hypothetical protein
MCCVAHLSRRQEVRRAYGLPRLTNEAACPLCVLCKAEPAHSQTLVVGCYVR